MSPRSAFAMTLVAAVLCVRVGRADPTPTNDATPGGVESSADTNPDPCPSNDETVCGRQQFQAGTRAFVRGEFEDARRAFQAALALRPHPVIRYNLAVCWARLGKPSAAVAELRLVLGDAEADKALRARSERELRLAEQAQAHVSFTLSDPGRDRLELDGVRVDPANREFAVDPGLHHARITSGASVVLDQDLELATGERIELRVGQRSRRIDVVVVSDPTLAADGAAASSPAVRPDYARHGLSPTWFIAAAGTTAVLTGLTIWSGLDTRSAHSEYESRLPTLTQAEADRRVSDGHSRELRTNLLLSGSLLCAAGTAVLGIWFVDFGGSHPASVSLGVGQLSLTTQF
ncbi:MAG: tetratricopeptide repeat protein [Polyangiaceae bacterium]